MCVQKHALLLHNSHGAFGLLNIAASDIYVQNLCFFFFLFLARMNEKPSEIREIAHRGQVQPPAPAAVHQPTTPTSSLTAAFGSDRLETPAQFNPDKVKAQRLSEAESADSHAAAQ